MKYRPLDSTGDYTVARPFLSDAPVCVAQAILTRLKLWVGEFFVDVTDGTPYETEILGPRGGTNPDAAIQQRILGTPHVLSITSYESSFDSLTRALTVNATVLTDYGPVTISETLT